MHNDQKVNCLRVHGTDDDADNVEMVGADEYYYARVTGFRRALKKARRNYQSLFVLSGKDRMRKKIVENKFTHGLTSMKSW